MRINYIMNGSKLVGYLDSDFAGDLADRKYTTEFIFQLFDGEKSWRYETQSIVMLSTPEEKYFASYAAARGAILLKGIGHILGILGADPL